MTEEKVEATEEQLEPNEEATDELETEATEEQVKPTTEPETITLKKDELDAILDQKMSEKYKTIQQTLSKKDRIIKELQTQQPQEEVETFEAMVKFLERPDEYGNIPEGQRSELAKIKASLHRMKIEKQQKAWRAQAEVKRDDMHQKITEAGLEPDDEVFLTPWALYNIGFPDIAAQQVEAILAKRQKKQEKTEVKKVAKTEEELRKEVEAEVLKKYKLVKQDTGGPTGASGSRGDVIAKYARGEATREEYEKAISTKS